jgi:uncharacterized RDD family membrane protein YckC
VSTPAAGLGVDSDTGVDVSLPVAGPGARAYAFIIDWHIRLLLALAWLVCAAVLINGDLVLRAPPGRTNLYLGTVIAPTLAIYFLYHPLLEASMRGSTPGKRRAGIHVVSRSGAIPGIGALLVRNVFRLVDALPAFYGLGLLFMLLTKNNLRLGDMAAGTLLVYERSPNDPELLRGAALRSSRLDASGAEIATDLLQRWDALSPEARVRLARALLQRYGDEQAQSGDADQLTWRARIERLAQP